MNLLISELYSSFITNNASVCLKIGDQKHTYAEVLELSNAIRSQIRTDKNANVGIFLTDDVYMYASILALWLEGRTYVPVHPDFPLSKNLSVIHQAELTAVLSSVPLEKTFPVTCILTTAAAEITAELPAETDMLANAYILFTSGSTGEPKGVPITFSNLYYFAQSFQAAFGTLKKEDQVLQMFELTFDLSVMSYLIPWLNGAAVVALHKKETKFLQILDLLEADEITVALMVPSILNLIIPYLEPGLQNKSLRMNLFCGEALLLKQIAAWKSFIPKAEIYNVYGPTENTIFCTSYHVKDEPKEKNGIISIGQSLAESSMGFLDPEANEGELLLSGKLLSHSYWKNKVKTEDVFFKNKDQNCYKTGDWCVRDEEGDFFYLNRIDFQAKINGFRVELSEIEYFANQVLHNALSVAVLTKDQTGNDILTLFTNDAAADEKMILAHLKDHLADYCIPSKIITLKNFPTNTSGKTDRNELKKLV